MIIPVFKTFPAFDIFRFFAETCSAEKKNDFLLADLEFSPKNQIQSAVKVLNDGETLWKLYGMLKRSLRI